MLNQTTPYRLFLLWSIYFGAMCFLIWLSWQMNILVSLFASDPTKITYLISLFFIGGTIHCGIRSFFLSVQLNSIDRISRKLVSYSESESLPARFLATMAENLREQNLDDETQKSDKQLLTDVYASQTHSQHEMGWFVTSLLVKLGLLGTVIGFVLMLQPLATLESFDIADIQSVLTSMTSGMSVALNTTLLGLISSMLLSFQYLLLDRGADELVIRTVHYMETSFMTELRTERSN